MSKRVFSGIQPTGEVHLGNYFGAIKNWVKIQDEYDAIFCVVDLHAMTMPYDPKELHDNSLNLAINLMACGIDPEKATLFIQSMVPQHSELTWVFSCVTSFGELSRMTQFKDKSTQLESTKKGSLISAGLFTYPILQAADILVYKAGLVPVGKDQEQHLELSRNIAVRFNNQFGECFPEPKPLYTETSKILSLADPTRKMGKSLGPKHYVGLFEEEKSIRKKVRSAVTDTGNEQAGEMSPGVANLFSLLKASEKLGAHDSLMKDYHSGSLRYVELKDAVGDAMVELTSGFIQKRKELLDNRSQLEGQIKQMAERAREMAEETMREVRQRTGMPG